jgi:hypothetical protein
MVFEAVVTAEHQLHWTLPESFPVGSKLRVTVEPIDSGQLRPVSADTPPRTSLWGQLEALREQAARQGVLPEPLSWDGILAEMERRRGERNE